MPEGTWLLDTTIFVDLLRGSTKAQKWIDSLPPDSRFLSVVTIGELLAGCRDLKEQQAVEKELLLYKTVWLDELISKQALAYYRKLRLSHGVGSLDCLIGATAKERAMQVASLNLKHFTALPGVKAMRPY